MTTALSSAVKTNKKLPLRVLDIAKDYPDTTDRFALIAREAYRNCGPKGAKRVWHANCIYNKRTYLAIFHDGTPFHSIDEMEQALTLNTSLDEYGFQGCGMKIATLLGYDNLKNCELILISKNIDGEKKALSLTITDQNKYVIREDEEVVDLFEYTFPDFDSANVAYLYRYDERKERRAAKHSIISARAFTSGKNIAHAVFCCSLTDSLEIIVSDSNRVLNLGDEPQAMTWRACEKKSDYFNDLSDKHFKYVLKNFTFENGFEEQSIMDVEVGVYGFPGLQSSNHPINLNKNKKGEYQCTGNYYQIPDHKLFVTVENIIENDSSNRIEQDPVFVNKSAYKYCKEAGVYFPDIVKFKKRDAIYEHGKEKYKEIFEQFEEKENFCYRPHVKFFINIKFKNPTHIRFFGTVNEFFDVDRKEIFNALLREIFTELGKKHDFLNQIKEIKAHYFPEELSDGFVPITFENKGRKHVIVDVYDSDGYVIEKVEPGEQFTDVTISTRNTLPLSITQPIITNSIQLINNGDVYNLIISDYKKVIDGKPVKVTKDDYQKSKDKSNFYPKTYSGFEYNGEYFLFSFKIKVPVQTSKSKESSEAIKQSKSEGPGDEKKSSVFIPMSPHFYGKLVKGKVYLNSENPEIRSIACFNHLEFPVIKNKVQKLYEELLVICNSVEKEMFFMDLDYKKGSSYQNKSEMYEGDCSANIINITIASHIKNSKLACEIRKQLQNVNPSENEDENE